MSYEPDELIKIQEDLNKRKESIFHQISHLEAEDPIYLTTAYVSESGTDAWEADVHIKTIAVKNRLLELSKQIDQTLNLLRIGKYGECQNCYRQINAQRLSILPTATICERCLSV